MSKLIELKKELQELRENTLNEFKDMDSTGFDSDAKENWSKRKYIRNDIRIFLNIYNKCYSQCTN